MSRTRGFSVAELLIGTVVSTLLLLGVHALWRSGVKSSTMGNEIMVLTKELSRITLMIQRDCQQTSRVLWGDGPMKASAGQTDYSELLSQARGQTSETILEKPGKRVTYRLRHNPDSYHTLERYEETVQLGAISDRTMIEYGRNMIKSFRLFPLEKAQGGALSGELLSQRLLVLELILGDPTQKKTKREFRFETVFCPSAIAQTSWNTFR